ncbi:hypothetical protein N7449_005024 [Penicillium cf. viridicatum]|uniref:Uncharacterized protein n=1 Tax=Penicillium cf. viridicatum TaxID=2972119 RepID=A0A9W9MKN0_9EURO|nr:hypothetical protein N7449_005024 [Penicillium cf. viridicatum]
MMIVKANRLRKELRHFVRVQPEVLALRLNDEGWLPRSRNGFEMTPTECQKPVRRLSRVCQSVRA